MTTRGHQRATPPGRGSAPPSVAMGGGVEKNEICRGGSLRVHTSRGRFFIEAEQQSGDDFKLSRVSLVRIERN